MNQYLNLAIGAKARLAILKRNFDNWFIKNPHAPRERVKSWRDLRFATFRSRDNWIHCGLQDDKPVWYASGEVMPEKDANEVVRMDHTGWYTDAYCDETSTGIIVKLPHGRYLAGYRWSSNGERAYFPEIFTDADDAANMADEHARVFAEKEREYSERYREAQDLADKVTCAIEQLQEKLALRNIPKFRKNSRDKARLLIDEIRNTRDKLKNEFADIDF